MNINVEAISPAVLPTELASGGEQASAKIGDDNGGVASQAHGEVIEGPNEEEIQTQSTLPSPVMPTSAMRAEHKACGHLPYRSWCDHCVEAFGRERAHASGSPEERTFPLISIDYLFLSPKGVIFKEDVDNKWNDPPEDCIRVLAGRCSATKALMAIAVPRKGADAEGYAAKTLSENINWLGHSRIGIRSDNEPAMLQLVSSATNLLRLGV